MGLLDGLQAVFGQVFGSIFPDGKLRQKTLTDNGKGGYTAGSPNDYDIKVLIETATEEMRGEADYNDKDVSLIILQYQVPVKLTLDDHVYAQGAWWAVKAPINDDPAHAAWIARGSPSNG